MSASKINMHILIYFLICTNDNVNFSTNCQIIPMMGHLRLLQHFFSALFLRGEAGNCPHFDLNAVIKLLPSHVPHSLVGRRYGTVLPKKTGGISEEIYGKPMQPHITPHYPSSILQDRGWKDPPRHLSHVIFHFDPKLLDVRVKVEVCILHLWRAKITSHILQLTCSALHP